MRTVRLLVASLAIGAGVPAIAGAQDTPRTGVVFAYPTAFGILWHASDKIAIRPEFSVSWMSQSSSPPNSQLEAEASGWGSGFGLSALFYLHTEDRLRTYVVPRFAYSHMSADSTGSSGITTDVDADSYGGSGSFGAQYGLGRRFALFGEVGFGFDRQTSDTTAGTKVKNSSWGLRSGVGVVFYP